MFEDLLKKLVEWCTSTGIKIVIAIIVLIVAFKIINAVCRKFSKKLEAQKKHINNEEKSTQKE